MKIVHLSDTHGDHELLEIPEGDVLVHSGDFSSYFETPGVEDFLAWFSGHPHPHKIIVPGNHDFFFENHPDLESLSKSLPGDVSILVDKSVVIQGVKFHGSPWQPPFYNWAFNLEEDLLQEKWALIPEDTDVLITHTPSKGVLDRNRALIECGSESLRERVKELPSLKLHLFGHIHEDAGDAFVDGVVCVNASIQAGRSPRLNPPREIMLNDGKISLI